MAATSSTKLERGLSTMWLVNQSDEAERYVDDNHPFIIELMLAIGRLMLTDDGLPIKEALRTLDEDGYYLWADDEPYTTHRALSRSEKHPHRVDTSRYLTRFTNHPGNGTPNRFPSPANSSASPGSTGMPFARRCSRRWPSICPG